MLQAENAVSPTALPVDQSGESEGLMGVLAECPICRRKQSIKNKKCKCSENLVKSKKQNKVRY